jgi:hypothetical protein
MSDLQHDLQFIRRWWWDPIDMEIFKKLDDGLQRNVLGISLETQAQILKTHAAGLDKIGAALRGGGKT